MGVVSDLVAEVQKSFDVDPADALTVLDRRHKLMCDRAQWWRMSRPVFITTTGGPFDLLDVPDDAVEVFSIRIPVSADALTFRMYHRGRQGDYVEILASTLVVPDDGGVFVELAPADDTITDPQTRLVLYPPIGFVTTALLNGAFVPPTLTTTETAGGFVRIPVDYHDALLAGVYASLLSRPNEARPDLAATQEQAFSGACSELKDRADRRYRTKGPRQIRLAS